MKAVFLLLVFVALSVCAHAQSKPECSNGAMRGGQTTEDQPLNNQVCRDGKWTPLDSEAIRGATEAGTVLAQRRRRSVKPVIIAGLVAFCLIGLYIRYELNKLADRHARE